MVIKIISPTHGEKEVLFDKEDFEKINNRKWYIAKMRKTFYVRGSKNKDLMHRLLLNFPKNKVIDHINGNTLDNRKKNLRICDHHNNCKNRGKQKNNTSGYKGVYLSENIYKARIKLFGKTYYLGSFKNIIEAAACYDNYAKIFHGEFACLNGVINDTWCRR